jgi:hypothetical protein
VIPVLIFPAFTAAILSIIGLSYLAWKEHERGTPRTLSELAALKPNRLWYFRIVLWLCGSLFAVTMYGYIVPHIRLGGLQAAAWSLTYFPELILGVFPAKGNTIRFHTFMAYLMAFGMLSSAILFAVALFGNFALIESLISGIMVVLSILTITDKRHFIFYELPFIFFAHGSILVAAYALR